MAPSLQQPSAYSTRWLKPQPMAALSSVTERDSAGYNLRPRGNLRGEWVQHGYDFSFGGGNNRADVLQHETNIRAIARVPAALAVGTSRSYARLTETLATFHCD